MTVDAVVSDGPNEVSSCPFSSSLPDNVYKVNHVLAGFRHQDN